MAHCQSMPLQENNVFCAPYFMFGVNLLLNFECMETVIKTPLLYILPCLFIMYKTNFYDVIILAIL